MTTIVTRAGKGGPLTNGEMDANLNNLNNDKLEAAAIANMLETADIGTTVQAYDADIATDAATQLEMEAGTEAALRSMSPLRIKQAIAALTGSSKQIQPITASVAANALTITLNPTSLDFRSATLGSGSVNTRSVGTAISLTVPETATLGTINAIQNRLVVLAIDNAGTVELAVVNIAGGNDLSETGVITTIALSTGADSNNVIYSTTARTGVPYRVVGYVESTQATAGTWATTPSQIQGAGGLAMAGMNSLGYGQTWQNVTGSRALSTTYYNTTGKPINVSVTMNIVSGAQTLTIGGVAMASSNVSPAAGLALLQGIVPAGASYSVTVGGSNTINLWAELR